MSVAAEDQEEEDAETGEGEGRPAIDKKKRETELGTTSPFVSGIRDGPSRISRRRINIIMQLCPLFVESQTRRVRKSPVPTGEKVAGADG